MVIRIALGDCQTLFRQGLKHMLDAHHGFEVVAETGDGAELAKAVSDVSPDIVITEVSLRNLDGIEATRMMRAANANTRVIALSNSTERRFVVGMLTAGACGYLSKECCFDELVDAVRSVAAGRTHLSAPVSDIVINDHFHNMENGSGSPSVPLSSREQQVLQLLAEGFSRKEIAEKCVVSLKTVETYRQRLMHKLNVSSFAELVKYAIRAGLTTVEKQRDYSLSGKP